MLCKEPLWFVVLSKKKIPSRGKKPDVPWVAEPIGAKIQEIYDTKVGDRHEV